MNPEQKTIIKDLVCSCGAKCGELALPASHPLADAPLSAHGIEKVECDNCRKKREGTESNIHKP